MSAFDTPETTAARYDALASMPAANAASMGPGIFDGFGTELAKAPGTVVGRGVLNLEEAATPAIESFGKAIGRQDLADWALDQQKQYRKFALDNFMAPADAGWAAQNLVHGVVVPAAEMIGTASVGGPPLAAGYEGLTAYNVAKIQYEAQGVRTADAQRLAAGQGLVAAGMGFLPGTIGFKAGAPLLTNALRVGGVQAAIGVAAGGGTRYATQQYLAQHGYDAMAAQMHPFSVAEAVTDAALGFAFGYGATRLHGAPARPSDIVSTPTLDDAMAVNSAGHAQIDVAPGVPVDVAAANAHARALEEATMAQAAGKPVAVDEIVRDAHFAEPPEILQQRAEMEAGAREASEELYVARDARRAEELAAQPPRDATPPLDDAHIATLAPDQQGVLRGLYRDAADRKPGFDQALGEIAAQFPGADLRLPALKGTERAVAKISNDYGGNASRIKDLLRASLVVDNVNDVPGAIQSVLDRFPGSKVKRNGFAEAEAMDGYRDVLINVDVAGHTSEVQVHVPEMIAAKDELHTLYKQRETLMRQLEREKRPMTDDEFEAFNDLSARMRAGYDAAFAKSRNRASEIRTPRAAETADTGSGLPSDQRVATPSTNDTGSPSTSKNNDLGGNEGGSDVMGRTSNDIVPPAGAPEAKQAPREVPFVAKGNTDTVKVGDTYEPVTWALVDAGAVEAATAKGENQARDRSRAASDAQVAQIAANIDFRLLGASPQMDFGAPTLAADGRVVGGNGRVLAIQRAYETGNGDAYAAPLKKALPEFGIDQAALEGVKAPMLVRVLDKSVDVRAAALASNEGAGMRMSLLEQASVDAERLPPLAGFYVPEDGNLNAPANRDFIMAWVGHFPGTEQAALVDANGALSQEGLLRLRNAVLVKAYGDSPTLQRMVELADPGARNVSTALTKAAPPVAAARDAIRAGALHPVDPMPDLLAAVEQYGALKATGERVPDFLAQGELLGGSLNEPARRILAFLDAHARSARAMSDMVAGMYRALEAAGNPKEGDFFGGRVPSVDDLVAAGIGSAERPGALTGSLFDTPDAYPGSAHAPRSKASVNYEAATRVEQAKAEGGLFETAVDCARRQA